MAKKNKLKAGEIRVQLEEENIIWTDRKRLLPFGLPWSFTKYTLSETRLFFKTGFIRIKEEEIRLYRISDVTYMQGFWERLCRTGTICLLSSDVSMPEAHLIHVKNARKVKDVISHFIEEERKKNGVRTSELVGGHTPLAPRHDEDGKLDPPDDDPRDDDPRDDDPMDEDVDVDIEENNTVNVDF